MGPSPLLFDLTGRGAVVLTGKDRASFLHGLVTNDVRKLTPGTGCAAAFLTLKGKLLADCVVLCEEDRLEIDCEPELAKKIEDLLRKYLVFNEVEIGNLTSETAVFHLRHSAAGDAVEDLLRKVMSKEPVGAGDARPRDAHSHATARVRLPPPSPFKENTSTPDASKSAGDDTGIPIRLVRENRTGVPGFDVRCPSSHSEEIRKAFLAAGARQASDADLESLRIEAGIPRWGYELTEAVLPDEAGLRERGFISDTKGCYVGQETVARIKTYGHVNRLLVRVSISGGIPATGSDVFFEGEKVGSLTSVAPASGDASPDSAVALAYVKRERAAEGTALTISFSKEDPRSLPSVVAPPGPG